MGVSDCGASAPAESRKHERAKGRADRAAGFETRAGRSVALRDYAETSKTCPSRAAGLSPPERPPASLLTFPCSRRRLRRIGGPEPLADPVQSLLQPLRIIAVTVLDG